MKGQLNARMPGLRATRRLGTGGGSGPVTDPIVQSINADGWSFTASGTPPTFAPDSSPQFAYVTRAGFDSSGVANTQPDTVILTQRIRQPYPNQATLTADQGALSDFIYQDDVIVGKTNNSTERSPKPVCNWARVDRRVVGNSFPKEWAELTAFHRDARNGKQVACAKWIFSDGVNSVTVTSSTMVIFADLLDRNPIIGYRPASDIDLSSLTNGQITMNAEVYPHFGYAGSVTKSADIATGNRGFCTQTFTKNPTLYAAPPYAYVATTGNDATGVVSTTAATAKATPFLTTEGAIAGLKAATGVTGGVCDGCIIRLGAGTFAMAASVAAGTYQNNAECIIERDPAVSKASAIYQFGAGGNRTTRLNWLRVRDCSILRAGTFGLTGLTGYATLENVDFDNGSFNATWVVGFSGNLIGVTITNLSASLLNAGTPENRLMRGVTYGALGGGTSVEGWNVIGCNFKGVSLVRGARTQSKSIIAFNKFMGIGASVLHSPGGSEDIDGHAFVQNVVEHSVVTNNPAMRPSGDSATGNITHLIDQHNTFAGFGVYGRSNYLYNETSGVLRTHKLCTSVGTIAVQFNIKADVFSGSISGFADASSRIGTWSATFGVGNMGLFSMFRTNAPSSEAHDFPGLNASIGTSTTVRNDPLFTSNQATTSNPTAGAGNGDYTLQAGSPCIGRVKRQVLPFDLAGVARSSTATASGAYERLAA